MKSAARPRRSPRLRRLVLASAPALVLMLAGCEMHEQTQGWYPRYDGVTAEAGEIGLRNVVVIAAPSGQATVLTSFANRGAADDLLEVRIAEVTAEPTDGPLAIPQNGYAALGPESLQVALDGVDLVPGQLVEVEFRFEDAPRTTVDAIVKEPEGRYANVTLTEPEELETEEPAGNGSDDGGTSGDDGEDSGETDEADTDEPSDDEPSDDETPDDEAADDAAGDDGTSDDSTEADDAEAGASEDDEGTEGAEDGDDGAGTGSPDDAEAG
ncbi:hypothetical protein [Phytoactinopolyspora endophytica]|uniref:hypothetical protein n=1 Tax=Phytoactinopolyspora endophytica TaxID=1642495 RepID=UPI00101C9522|nr:hypothetical protein [Phytoactinopolyspora endophytica]